MDRRAETLHRIPSLHAVTMFIILIQSAYTRYQFKTIQCDKCGIIRIPYNFCVLLHIWKRTRKRLRRLFSWIPASVPPGLRRNDGGSETQIINGIRIINMPTMLERIRDRTDQIDVESVARRYPWLYEPCQDCIFIRIPVINCVSDI